MSDGATVSTASSPVRAPATPPPALDPDEFRRLGHRAVDMLADWLAGIGQRPVFTPMTPTARADLLDQSLPEAGAPPAAILDRFVAAVLPHPTGNGHPRFFGWVNSPPAPIGVLAELLAAGMNPSCAGGDRGAIYVERCATRWLMELPDPDQRSPVSRASSRQCRDGARSVFPTDTHGRPGRVRRRTGRALRRRWPGCLLVGLQGRSDVIFVSLHPVPTRPTVRGDRHTVISTEKSGCSTVTVTV